MELKQPVKYELEIPSDLDRIQEVENFTDKVAIEMNFSEDERDSLAIAVTETVNNAILHGNKNDQTKVVKIVYILNPANLTIQVKDQGKGFDPNSVDNPCDPKNLLKECGRGVFIIRALMDQVSFEQDGTGMLITLVKIKKT